MSAEINEWVLQTRGWRAFEEKDPAKWETSAFVDPEGRWFNVPSAEHFKFAMYVLTELKCLTEVERRDLDLHKASSDLVEMGWLLIHYSNIGIVINGHTHMTMPQYRALKRHFGDRPLKRSGDMLLSLGMTIDMLWKEKKTQAIQEDLNRT